MGIISRIKRRLPIVGAGGNQGQGPEPARAPAPKWEPEPEPASARGDQDVATFIDEFVKSNQIVLFMKGSPSSPQCGFSANASAILKSYGKPIAHFDILSDPEVREGVKTYSQWPTLPQIYINGEFVGGSDILSQMHEGGDLKGLIEQAG